jgi:hypothetical protein
MSIETRYEPSKTVIEDREIAQESKIMDVVLGQEQANEILEGNDKWLNLYKEYIDETGVYAMSPEVCERVSKLAQTYLTQMKNFGLQDDDAWAVEDGLTYMEKLLNRVNVPDTFRDTIERNVMHGVKDLKEKQLNEPNRLFNVRSFFTGAAIAEKGFLMRANQVGVKNINLITTDNSEHSIAFAAANLSVWNATLAKEDKYDIKIVKGEIPAELYNKPKTIILQIEDAKIASEKENCKECGWDMLLVDNGFPYVGTDFVETIVGNALENRASDGMLIAMLGLNERTKVEIPTIEKLKKIMNKDIIQDTKERLEKDGHETPNGYTHLYNYKTDTKGNILIKDVYSYGGAKVYNEIKQLLVKGEIKLALRVLNSIKKATSLSSATTEIVTNPTESHEETIRQIESRKINHQVIEESIDYTKEGWTRVVPTEEESSVSYMWFEKNGERHSIKDIAEEMRLKDPVVLQTTVVKVL